MNDKDTDIPAFPTGTWEYDGQNNVLPYQQPGMTLRDYFAAKAMQGFIASMDARRDDRIDVPQLAKSAYSIADGMLKAREA